MCKKKTEQIFHTCNCLTIAFTRSSTNFRTRILSASDLSTKYYRRHPSHQHKQTVGTTQLCIIQQFSFHFTSACFAINSNHSVPDRTSTFGGLCWLDQAPASHGSCQRAASISGQHHSLPQNWIITRKAR